MSIFSGHLARLLYPPQARFVVNLHLWLMHPDFCVLPTCELFEGRTFWMPDGVLARRYTSGPPEVNVLLAVIQYSNKARKLNLISQRMLEMEARFAVLTCAVMWPMPELSRLYFRSYSDHPAYSQA